MVINILNECLAAEKENEGKLLARFSMTIKDATRCMDVFGDYKNGFDKNTEYKLSRESLVDLPNYINNFFLKWYSKFSSPVINYKIKFDRGDRINTLDFLEARPDSTGDFLERFLQFSTELIFEKSKKTVRDLNSQVLINDLMMKNYLISTLCVVSEKSSELPRSLATLNNCEWLVLISKYINRKNKLHNINLVKSDGFLQRRHSTSANRSIK